jgi:CDP-paratose 2-epimerase
MEMSVAVVIGSSGLIESEAVAVLCGKRFGIVGPEGDMRACFFGRGASTTWNREAPRRVGAGAQRRPGAG